MRIYLPEVRQNEGKVFPYNFEGKIPDSFGVETGPHDRLLVKAGIRISGGKILLKGVLEVDYISTCCRCLKKFNRHVEAVFDETFTLREGIPVKENPAELASQAANYLTVTGDVLYPEEYLRQVFLLAQGYRTLCRDDCRGLCPLCGADLNESPCNCTSDKKRDGDEEVDPRLKALKDYFPRR